VVVELSFCAHKVKGKAEPAADVSAEANALSAELYEIFTQQNDVVSPFFIAFMRLDVV
jgi:hypothetical protein